MQKKILAPYRDGSDQDAVVLPGCKGFVQRYRGQRRQTYCRGFQKMAVILVGKVAEVQPRLGQGLAAPWTAFWLNVHVPAARVFTGDCYQGILPTPLRR